MPTCLASRRITPPLTTSARLTLAAVLSAASLSGCTADVCQRDSGMAVPYREGKTNTDRTFYETTTWDSAWLTFPSGIRYQLKHGLGAQPVDMNIWISLEDKPWESEKPATPSAGNQTLLWEVTATDITISNDTCADVFVRLTAWTEPESEPFVGELPLPDAGATPNLSADAGN